MKLEKIFFAVVALAAIPAFAADDAATFELMLKDHRFTPAEIKVPAGKPITLHVKNGDSTAEEFDSDDLTVEKVITPGATGTIHLHALNAGRYKFEGEYHEDTAQGVLVAE